MSVTALAGSPRVGPPPAQMIMELAWGMWPSAVIRAAAQLSIADTVDHDPVDVREMAVMVGANPDALARLMRALASFGIFRQVRPRQYAHTASSRALRADSPTHVRDIVLTGGNWGWETWGHLADSVRTGQPAFHRIFGKDLFAYFDGEDEPGAGTLCYNGYRAQARAMDVALAGFMDLTGVGTVVEVGGGSGSLLRALLERNRDAFGVLFDREPALAQVDAALRDGGALAARCRMEAGDCLEALPVADLYVYRQVLHMWADGTCIKALSTCAAAAPRGGRVVLAEQLVSDPPEASFDTLMDLHMLLVTGGRERTAEEYRHLLESAGWRNMGVTLTSTPLRLLEAVIPLH